MRKDVALGLRIGWTDIDVLGFGERDQERAEGGFGMTDGSRKTLKGRAALRDGGSAGGGARRRYEVEGVGGVDLAYEIGLVGCGQEGLGISRVSGFEAQSGGIGCAEVFKQVRGQLQ